MPTHISHMHMQWWPLLYGTIEATAQQVFAAAAAAAYTSEIMISTNTEMVHGKAMMEQHGRNRLPATSFLRYRSSSNSSSSSSSSSPSNTNSNSFPAAATTAAPFAATYGSAYNSIATSMSSTLLTTTTATLSSSMQAASTSTSTSPSPSPSSLSSSSSSLVANVLETLTTFENDVSNSLSHSLDAFVAVTPMALLGNFSWPPSSSAATAAAVATALNPNISNTITANNNSHFIATSSTTIMGNSSLNASTSVSSSSSSTAAMIMTSTTLAPSVDSYLVGMAWPKALVVAIFMLLILVTVVGNTLVILAVLTTRRLRTVTNCFVLNLAITDWLVGTCVMPPAVMVYIVGSWRLGWILCDIWISLDVLLCTASILSLCAISLDRYLAVTQPLTYSKNRRTKRLALLMIFIVWVTALSITCPPYLGWYEPGRRVDGNTVCRYNQNKGYVVFSAMGSFFIPLAVMLYVYLKIGYVLTSRRQRIVRDANSERTADHDIDCDNFLSESEHFQCGPQKFPSFKSRWTVENATNGSAKTINSNSKQSSLKCSKCSKNYTDPQSLKHQASFYELMEISRLSTQIPCPSINCKYGDGRCTPTKASMSCALAEGRAATLPMQQLHCSDSRTSFSETCLAHAMAQSAAKYTSNGQVPDKQLQSAQMNVNAGQLQHNAHSHAHQHHHPHHHHHRVPMRVSTTKRDTKTAKTLTMVMGGFIACWLPFFTYYLLIPFLPPAALFEGLMSFLTWVGWVNCAINPFIYAFYNPDFRTAFWRLTCKRICKQKSPPNHMAMFRG
uniref:G-protein coupled receptors family 1 profile domain-containing protein n=1 Tax=Stomoxys calcitrans TaxID=35570 RepID=A0A1I8P5D7_STOCA